RLGVARVADREGARLAEEGLDESVGDPLVDIETLELDADLPGVGEGRGRALLRRGVEVGVAPDDPGRVASELEEDLLPRGPLAHLPAGRGAPGEGDDGDARVVEERTRVGRQRGEDV